MGRGRPETPPAGSSCSTCGSQHCPTRSATSTSEVATHRRGSLHQRHVSGRRRDEFRQLGELSTAAEPDRRAFDRREIATGRRRRRRAGPGDCGWPVADEPCHVRTKDLGDLIHVHVDEPALDTPSPPSPRARPLCAGAHPPRPLARRPRYITSTARLPAQAFSRPSRTTRVVIGPGRPPNGAGDSGAYPLSRWASWRRRWCGGGSYRDDLRPFAGERRAPITDCRACGRPVHRTG